VLGAERDEVADRSAAQLDQPAQELAALREANGVVLARTVHRREKRPDQPGKVERGARQNAMYDAAQGGMLQRER
jgi:hypothetical protein